MSRIKCYLSYDGSAYHGWQIQQNAVTVQGVLQEALQKLFGCSIAVHGCSRTDAGVHAREFVCHFDLPHPFPADRMPLALNALLPGDVVVKKAEACADDFHARFHCKGKTYCYRLWNDRVRDPFELSHAGFWPTPLRAEAMNRSAAAFVGTHDFSAFMATGSKIEDAVRTIYDCAVTREDHLICFFVTGNGFLYNMVRIMVGTLIYDDLGKLDRSISEIIASRDRTLAGITVPPQGLFLEKVYY